MSSRIEYRRAAESSESAFSSDSWQTGRTSSISSVGKEAPPAGGNGVQPMRPTATDPSCIVGMACRVPGAQSPSKMWDNILQQRDLQRKMPADRFNIDNFFHPDGTNKGTTNATAGYFLEQDLSSFDAGFFNISGKEAESMDPQQRLLLEVVYEALEDAGIPLADVAGSQTSVYCGSFTNDYKNLLNSDLGYYPKYAAVGVGNTILSNRISYFYDLHGPSMTVDTACSSSLVCFDMGNKSIQNENCDLSLVVGSALHFDPSMFVMMTDIGFLSTDGRCRAFDASGKGYVRGEGICAAVLKRKSRAERDGNRIRSIVRGTDTNHDGTKDGITMPNSAAQETLMRACYKKAGLETHDTQYFEAHGTGTQAGDPREARAIGACFAPNRTSPLYVGSVKTNMGHLEGASGLVGIIKTTLALEAGKIPPNMLFNNPNPNIDFQKLNITVPTKLLDWKARNGIRRGSINSFGYGGANAHAILEGYTPPTTSPRKAVLSRDHAVMSKNRPFLLPLSSHSDKAGNLLKDQLSSFILANPSYSTASIANSLSDHGRSKHQIRSYLIANKEEEIQSELAEPMTWIRSGNSVKRLGFVFTGQGAQHFAMGRTLIEQCPIFRQSLERCDDVLSCLPEGEKPDWSCVDELLKSKDQSRISHSTFSQPLCTAIQLAMTDLLAEWGIKPSITVGHSAGEMGAAYAAGIVSFDDAIVAAYYRGKIFTMEVDNAVKVPGAMMAIQMTEAEAKEELRPYHGRIKIAAVNSPTSLTLSGDEPAIDELKDILTEKKVFNRKLLVDKAYHSHHIAPYGPLLAQYLSKLQPMKAKCPMSSSVTARLAESRKMSGRYWVSNLTGQVRFSDALTNLLLNDEEEINVDALVEIGPHPALKGPVKEILKSLRLDIPYVPTLSRGSDDFDCLLGTAGQLFALGYPVDLTAVNSNIFNDQKGHVQKAPSATKVTLPSYAWDHSIKYWADTRVTRNHRLRSGYHEILGAPIPDSVENHPRWRRFLRPGEIPWLSQHVIEGKVIFPAAGYICIAIEAMIRLEKCPEQLESISLQEVSFKSALPLATDDQGTEVITELQPAAVSAKRTSDTWYRFTINSYDKGGRCDEHCHGLIALKEGKPRAVECPTAAPQLAQLKRSCDRTTTLQRYYEHLNSMGLQYGDDFRLISGNVESSAGFSLAPLTFRRDASVASQPNSATMVHPTFLDASFHVVFAACEAQLGRSLNEPYVPTFLKSMKVSGLFRDMMHSDDQQRFWVASNTEMAGPRTAKANIAIRSGDCSKLMIEMQGGEFTALGGEMDAAASDRALFFRTRWQPLFATLGASPKPPIESLGQAMQVFTHQIPDAKILHLTNSPESVKDVLEHLTAFAGHKRYFQSLTPYAPANDDPETWIPLAKEYNNRVEVEKPKTNEYDAVIIDEASELDIKSFLKPDGFAISTGPKVQQDNLTPVFSTATISVWQNQAPQATSSEPISIIMSSTPSESTEMIASAIERQHPGRVARINLCSLLETTSHLTDNVIVLASMDNQLFFDDACNTAGHFEAVRKLLTRNNTNMVWATKGATRGCPEPQQAIILGLARVARSENETLRLVTVDFPKDAASEAISRSMLRTLDRDLKEEEIAEQDGTLMIPRMEPDANRNARLPRNQRGEWKLEPLHQDRPLSLKIGKVGLLDTLAFADDANILDQALAEDELEIEVKASALNFRDVAASLGIIDNYRLGDECAGIVRQVGNKVHGFQRGDRVAAWRPGQGAHSSIVRNPATLCYKISDSLSFGLATSFPLTLTTAYFALRDSARLQPGETVLIHSAAGGVGQMAIQVAQMLGAKVIATVGSQKKREFLKDTYSLADSHILSSHDTSFYRGVMDLTHGRGVDVALNSLAGELLNATWSCIARFGRFIEIGKRDIHENSKLDMDPFRKNISFASVDMITVFEHNKELGARIFEDCCRLIEDGTVKMTPIMELPYADAQKAFRVLQMGKHIGKVVLTAGATEIVPVLPPTYRNQKLFDAEKVYLLVGGLGGLGRTLAEWMVRKGARNLAFMSRSGANRPEAAATVQWLRDRDINVHIHRIDVTDYASVKAATEEHGSRLAGVFQAAMVLQDTPLDKMTWEQWQTCMRPKVKGTYNLHTATLQNKLDFFVCFSSASAVIGTMAQANYSAANTYLDALMGHRRSLGLEGNTMNCGMIVGVGAVAEDVGLEQIMKRFGFDAVNEAELLYQIEEAVLTKNPPSDTSSQIDEHQTITGINTTGKDFYWCSKSLLRNVYRNLDLGDSGNKTVGKPLIASVREVLDIDARVAIITVAFIEKISAVLGVSADIVQPANPLSAYGLDSIVAIEFRKWFMKSINVDVQIFDVLGSKSITELVTKAAKMIKEDDDLLVADADAKTSTSDAKNVSDNNTNQVPAAMESDFAILPRPSKIPMSTFQRRMWFQQNFLEDKSSLNLPVACQIKGRIDFGAFEQAIRETRRRNDCLRMSFFEGESFSEQKMVADCDPRIEYEDFTRTADANQAIVKLMGDLKRRELDIEAGEVMSMTIIKRAEDLHTLIVIFHHISIDRGSSLSMLKQTTALYDAIRNGKPVMAVPNPKVSYIDFTIWHDARLKSPELRSSIQFWKNKMKDAPLTSHLLPFAKQTRPEHMSTQREILEDVLGTSMLARLKRICARTGTTPFQFLLAVLRSFHYRYTEEEDLTIHMVDSGRPHPDLEDTIGFFVNLVPIRFTEACDSDFDKLLEYTRTSVLEGSKHSTVPFDAIVDAVGVPKTTSHLPLGQMILNYQSHGKMPKFKTQDYELTDHVNEDIPTAAEMQLEAMEDPENGLNLRLEYNSTLYGAEDMERFFNNFLHFLKSVIKDYRQPICEVDMCGAKELEYLQKAMWNTEFTKNTWENQPIVDRILDMVRQNAQASAIQESGGASINYTDLAAQATKIAAALQQQGASAGDIVGVLSKPGIDAISAMLGALLIGCGYLPMDPEFANDRLSFMASDSGTRFILTGDGLMDLTAAPIAQALCFDTPHLIPLSEAKACKYPLYPSKAALNDTLYMVYTSGSTGKPKGVALTCSNTQQMLSTLHHDFSFHTGQRFLHQSSICFDLSIVQIWSALTSGGTVCVASPETRKDPERLAQYMETADVNVTYFTPTQFALLMETGSDHLKKIFNYRTAFFAGETLPVRLAKAFYDLQTPATAFNTWSPSELVVQTSIGKVAYPSETTTNIPIGHPMANCRHYVLDANLKPLPACIVGELCVGGAQVGAGYLDRPELNANAFITDPFCTPQDAAQGWTRFFRTGDKGRFLPDGQLEFHGRIAGDRQVKLRGFRIDLGEIEHRIHLESNSISGRSSRLVDLTVVAIPQKQSPAMSATAAGDVSLTDDRQLVAFMVYNQLLNPEERHELVAHLHASLSKHLNYYMLPSGYQFLSSLPVTIGGKVDRKAFLNMDLSLTYPLSPTSNSTSTPSSSASAAQQAQQAEQDDILPKICTLFQEILKLPKDREVLPDSNFFELGGQSILLLRAHSKLKRTFKIAPALKELFTAATPRLMAEKVRECIEARDRAAAANKGKGEEGK